MPPIRRVAPLMLSAALLAACTDSISAPATVGAPSLSVAEAAAPAPAHLVVFHNERGIPEGFAARVAALGGTVETSFPELGGATVRGLSAEAAAQLSADKSVRSVDLDVMMPMRTRGSEPAELEMASLDAEPASPTKPNTAQLYPYQWNMRAIGAPAAWAAGHLGSAAVTVAILDTGIDPTGRDLNGRVDLTRSVSFVPEDDAIVKAAFPTRHITTDLDGHGTNVASQVVSNGSVFAGVTSQTKLMAIKVCSIYGYCGFSATFAGIRYAADNGADVINMSLGGAFVKNDCNGCTAILHRAVNYAVSKGVTVVVAAGNESADMDHDGNVYNVYCSTPGVICVAATGPTSAGTNGLTFMNVDAPSGYSNFGRSSISVAAPGGNYLLPTDVSWVYSLCSRTKLNYNETTKVLSYTVCSANPAATYTSGYIGTSQASPHVAGLAALMVQRYGRSPRQIAAAIQQSADDLGQPGNDPFYGKGRINVATALGL